MNKTTQAAISLAKERLLPFCIINYTGFKLGSHIKRLAKKLEAVEKGECKRLIVTMPPRHCKSLLCSQLFPAWYLGKNSNKQIIAATYNHELARDFGRKVRNLMKQQEYQQTFETRLADDSSAIDRFNTNDDGVYIATGVGGTITGRGADVLLIDDPIKGREEADSEVIRKKVWEWYTSVARTRLMPGGAIVVIQTRWHKEDLVGKLLEESGEDWEVLHMPAINDEGKALWPEMWNAAELDSTRVAVGPREWQCLYQGNPVDPENQVFHSEFFRYYDELPNDKEITITMTVDPAFTTNKDSDYSCVMICGKYEDKTYVLEYVNKKLLPNDLINEILLLYKKWQPHFVGIESFAAQNVIGFYLQEKMIQEGLEFSWQEIKQSKNKDLKIKRLEPYFRDGKILLRKHHTDLEKQLLEFPQGKHDDIVDALQMSYEFRLFDIPSKTKEGEYWHDLGIQYNDLGEPTYE